MAGTSALFARKVNGDISTSLLQALDRIRNEAFAALQPETTEEKERDLMSPFVRPAVPLLVLDLSDPSTLRPVSADKAALLSVTADSPALSDTENSAILGEIKGGGITGGGSTSTSHAGATGPFAKAMKWLPENAPESACAIFLTDGETCSWGEDPGISVLWGIYNSEERFNHMEVAHGQKLFVESPQ